MKKLSYYLDRMTCGKITKDERKEYNELLKRILSDYEKEDNMKKSHYHVMTFPINFEEAKEIMGFLPHSLVNKIGTRFSIVKHNSKNEEIDNL